MFVSMSLACFVSQFSSNTKMLFVVLYGLIEIAQLLISRTKTVAGTVLVCLVFQSFSNTEILFVVLNGLFEIT